MHKEQVGNISLMGLTGMLAEGKTVGQALQAWRQPSSPEELPPPNLHEEEAKPESETAVEKSSTHQTDQPDINSRAYNAVLYGLPHIVFKTNS